MDFAACWFRSDGKVAFVHSYPRVASDHQQPYGNPVRMLEQFRVSENSLAYRLESCDFGLSIIRRVVVNCQATILSLETQVGRLRNKMETPVLSFEEQTGSPVV